MNGGYALKSFGSFDKGMRGRDDTLQFVPVRYTFRHIMLN